MKVTAGETFFKSLKKIGDQSIPWKWAFWEDKYLELKWIFWAIRKYWKITIQMRPWDRGYIIQMMKFQITILKEYIEKHEREIDETRIPKEKNMSRVIELMNHYENDDHAERCGYIHVDFEFVPFVDDKHPEEMGLTEMVSKETPKEEKINKKALKDSHKLQQKEWNEMFDIMKKDMQGWWD